jgi:hypothetical protein
MALKFNTVIENQALELLVAPTQLCGLKLPRHEQTTCFMHVETLDSAGLQV